MKHTAYHEAGHAVIGRLLGLPCGEATIIPNEEDGEAGYHIVADPWEIAHHLEQRGLYRPMRSIFFRRILTYMAGAEAENVLLGSCQGGDGDDRDQIDLMANSRHADLKNKWKRNEPRMRTITQALVRKHRDKIENVAHALLEHRRLGPEDIDALIEE